VRQTALVRRGSHTHVHRHIPGHRLAETVEKWRSPLAGQGQSQRVHQDLAVRSLPPEAKWYRMTAWEAD
jgi:hypothetical protein